MKTERSGSGFGSGLKKFMDPDPDPVWLERLHPNPANIRPDQKTWQQLPLGQATLPLFFNFSISFLQISMTVPRLKPYTHITDYARDWFMDIHDPRRRLVTLAVKYSWPTSRNRG